VDVTRSLTVAARTVVARTSFPCVAPERYRAVAWKGDAGSPALFHRFVTG
jgi:hypothetical protein